MSIDRIYREFSGIALVIFSLFLFESLFTFTAYDNVQTFDNDRGYTNSLVLPKQLAEQKCCSEM